jgi:anti-anti-sigma factor
VRNNTGEGSTASASDTSGPVKASDPAPGSSVPDLPVLGDPEPSSVHVIGTGQRTRIVISGEIDADLAPDLLEAAADAEMTGLPIEVDAQYVTFMDSSGIAFLARLASRSGERIRVLHAPDTVRFLLEVTRIGELLELVDHDDPDASETADEPTVPRVVRGTTTARPEQDGAV